ERRPRLFSALAVPTEPTSFIVPSKLKPPRTCRRCPRSTAAVSIRHCGLVTAGSAMHLLPQQDGQVPPDPLRRVVPSGGCGFVATAVLLADHVGHGADGRGPARRDGQVGVMAFHDAHAAPPATGSTMVRGMRCWSAVPSRRSQTQPGSAESTMPIWPV